MKKAEREKLMQEKLLEMQRIENELYRSGASYIGGVDEVGRGPLAGPVVCACVVMPRDFDVPGIDDSKKLTEKRRNEMAKVIRERALAFGLGMASEKVIDEINILEATRGAMRVAVDKAAAVLREKTGEDLSYVLFDAMTLPDLPYPQRSLVKGDQKSISIAAASIIAKVTRDAMMVKYAAAYPGYSFEKNKGYGTRAHYEGLREHGPCEIHRRSFLKNFLKGKE
ncbi:MAG: ribonuclease HII [Anaerovoracaceae bacterium]|jgi:ribonuclease HII